MLGAAVGVGSAGNPKRSAGQVYELGVGWMAGGLARDACVSVKRALGWRTGRAGCMPTKTHGLEPRPPRREKPAAFRAGLQAKMR